MLANREETNERTARRIPAASLRAKPSHQSPPGAGAGIACPAAGNAFSGCRFRRLAPLSGAMTRRDESDANANPGRRRRDQEKKKKNEQTNQSKTHPQWLRLEKTQLF